MDNQTETLAFSITPDEHLGSKIYTPKDLKTIEAINKTVSLFKNKVGPKTAKFVQLTIMEELPNYPKRSQAEIDQSMWALAVTYQETADKDPFDIISRVGLVEKRIAEKIDEEKTSGANHGISEINNLKLRELGKASVLINDAQLEIATKYPNEYLNHRAIQAHYKAKES